jgi:hypothetical protein
MPVARGGGLRKSSVLKLFRGILRKCNEFNVQVFLHCFFSFFSVPGSGELSLSLSLSLRIESMNTTEICVLYAEAYNE